MSLTIKNFLSELQEIEKEIRDVSHKLIDSSRIGFYYHHKAAIKEKKSELGSFSYQLYLDRIH